MRNSLRMLTMVLLVVALIGGLTITAGASDFSDYETAIGYLDSYADNVASDADFAANISASLDTVRESISSYGTFLSLLPPVIAIALALITKEV